MKRKIAKKLGILIAATMLSACEGVVDTIKDNETAQFLGLVLDQPCNLTRREGRRLAGAYLRQPVVAPLGFDTIFVTGRESRAGLPTSIVIDDKAVRWLHQADNADALVGTRRSIVRPRAGFAPEGSLPNVYSLAYGTGKINYTGPLVVGPGMAGFEIPTSGSQTFLGKIEVSLLTQAEDGTPRVSRSTGQFRIQAGYGAKRAQFRATGLGFGLPFDTLEWSNLYQCGTRLVSSGEGIVTTKSSEDIARVPFQDGRDPIPLISVFESSLFAPAERPAGPNAVGGVFVVQSDVGTITGVFLSEIGGG